MNENPFLNKKFLKDIKRCFVPSKLFNKNKYKYNIIDVEFKLKRNNLVQIIIKLDNGNKYEYTYILSEYTKQINKNKDLDDNILYDFETMVIDD